MSDSESYTKSMQDVIQSIKTLLGLSKDKEVAELLKMTGAALANHKSNGTLPYHNLLLFCHLNKVSFDYLLANGGTEKKTETQDYENIIGLQAELLREKERALVSEKERAIDKKRIAELELNCALKG